MIYLRGNRSEARYKARLAANDPGMDQGRNEHHHPKANREVLIGLLLVAAPWPVVSLILWCIFR